MYEMHSYNRTRTAYDGISSGPRHSARSQTRLSKMALLLGIAVFVALLPQPGLWAANSPASCPANFEVESISLTDWEAGLDAWTVGTYELAQPGAFETPDWAAVGGLPGGRAGTAAFAANLEVGACPGNDQSGVLTLTLSLIHI